LACIPHAIDLPVFRWGNLGQCQSRFGLDDGLTQALGHLMARAMGRAWPGYATAAYPCSDARSRAALSWPLDVQQCLIRTKPGGPSIRWMLPSMLAVKSRS